MTPIILSMCSLTALNTFALEGKVLNNQKEGVESAIYRVVDESKHIFLGRTDNSGNFNFKHHCVPQELIQARPEEDIYYFSSAQPCLSKVTLTVHKKAFIHAKELAAARDFNQGKYAPASMAFFDLNERMKGVDQPKAAELLGKSYAAVGQLVGVKDVGSVDVSSGIFVPSKAIKIHVAEMQSKQHLEPTGILDWQTLKALREIFAGDNLK